MGEQVGIEKLLQRVVGHGEELPWLSISQKAAEIEQTWADIRLELDRRSETWADATGVAISFENALESLLGDIGAKEPENAADSLARLSSSFRDVKKVLNRTEIDTARLAATVVGIVVAVVGLAVASRLVTNWRDPRFMLVKPTSGGAQP